jgi:replicative DNA helicase
MLDDRSLGPTPGELYLFIAPPTYGKSWFLVHLSKMALAFHKRVVYVSLEMSERRVAQRMVQTFCAVTKRQEEITTAYFQENDLGQLISIKQRGRTARSFEDKGIEAKLAREIKKFRRRSPLVIKQFPTGSLTIRELAAYLDSLEAQQKIIPDLLCVDYADLMHLDGKDSRISLGLMYKELRGIAVERNIAIATASQTNRAAPGKRLITGRDVAEDYSKIATADIILTYNQTDAERRLGTARLYVDKGRNEEAQFQVLIAQSYKTGQFCLRSRKMSSGQYWKIVEPNNGEKGGREKL